MNLVCHLRDLRGKRPLREMAELSGLSRGDLSRIEAGRMLPLDKWCDAIEQAYGAPREAWYPPEVLLVVRYPEEV